MRKRFAAASRVNFLAQLNLRILINQPITCTHSNRTTAVQVLNRMDLFEGCFKLTPTRIPNMSVQSSENLSEAKTLLSSEYEVPSRVLNELDVSKDHVTQLEVTSSSSPLYDALTKYFAQRGVDIDEEAPSLKDRIHDDPLNDEREYPGKLRFYQNPPSKFRDGFRRFRNFEKEEEEPNYRVTYSAGYGWGKILTNPCDDNDLVGNQKVIFHHYERGDPTEEHHKMFIYRFVVLYAKNDAIIKALNREALSWYYTREKIVLAAQGNKYVLYTLKVLSQDRPPSWICHGHRPARPCSSIILTPGVQEAMLSDAHTFFNKATKNWYYSHGVPYRRSYLLFGPPGTGKTSQIRALAGELGLKACFMSFSHKNFSDHTLIEAMSKVPKPSVLVFEDIDALFNKRENVIDSSLTFSGLLNAVDGVVSTEGTLIMMTTNYMEKLDPALLRCGRIDRRFEFKLPGLEEVARYFRSFYPDAPIEYSKWFAEEVFAREEKMACSLATLQQHFIYCRGESAQVALGKLDEFFKAYFPGGDAGKGCGTTLGYDENQEKGRD